MGRKMTISSYLFHHGIKGQKWGVRRFQNEDGSLTAEGKARLETQYERSGKKEERPLNDEMRAKERQRAGVENNIIKKGTNIYRVANKDETLDGRAKYVSVTEEDRGRYGEAFDMLGIDLSKPFGEYTYTVTHDLKIAGADKVLDHVMKKYGDVRLENMYKTVNEYHGMRDGSYYFKPEYRDKDHVEIDNAGHYVAIAKNEVTNRLNSIMTTNMSDIGKYFEKEGYDGFVDIEDYELFSTYPVILSTPVNSIELKEYKHYAN